MSGHGMSADRSLEAADDGAPSDSSDPGDASGGLEVVISKVLRLGVVASLTVMTIGVVVGFVDGSLSGDRGALDRLIDPNLAASHRLDAAWESLRSGGAVGIMTLGLCLLVATPLVRVVVSLVGFARMGDRIYLVLTSAVVALLALSCALGVAG